MSLAASARWSDYLLRRGSEFDAFWSAYLNASQRDLLIVLGRGFDPRMCTPLQGILGAGGRGRRDALLLEYDEGPESPSLLYGEQVKVNLRKLEDLVDGSPGRELHRRSVRLRASGHISDGSVSPARVFSNLGEFRNYSDVIIDVSAMPRSLYFPLVHKLLTLLNRGVSRELDHSANLHIVVAEDYQLDARIRDDGVDDSASYIHSFGAIDHEATLDRPKVWLPILGEAQDAQLRVIWEFVKPAEVCPVLPFPSRDLRRGDNLMAEYRHFLFEERSLDPGNIIYADERNPFQAYRQLRRAIVGYNHSLQALGGCRAVLSVLSSKLLSIGALLAAYELKSQGIRVGVAHVGARGYRVDGDGPLVVSEDAELCELWVSGDCYG